MNSSKNGNKVFAVIPFFNEERFIRDVVVTTLKYVDLVIAVNDGSNDKSEFLIKDIPDVHILSLKENMGKGYALQKGFEESLKYDLELVITLDADKQHSPDLIPDFIEAAANFDIVIGNRLHNIKVMPFMRILSNKITSKLLSIRTGQKITDSQCGFRIYKKKVLENIKTSEKGYEAESEILIKASNVGFKIGFITIPTIYENETSKMNPVKAIIGFIKVLLR